jgi:hypothetical protein
MWEAGAQSASQNCAKPAHFCAPRAQVRSGNKFLYKSLSSIFRNYNSSYTGAGKQAKESFMIVRFV